MKKRNKIGVIASAAATLGLLMAPYQSVSAVDEDVVKLRVLETTDIHVNLANYDYYKDTEVDKFGLVKTANLIKQAREEAQNSMLFDNGDLIQGNPLGDYVAKIDVLEEGETHPVYKVMNLLDYDAGNIGNHEFNYGLNFLHKSLAGSDFPYVNANVYIDDKDDDPSNDKNYFDPYIILDKKVVDEDGEEHIIKVGVIGFVPPQIMQWDKANLEGKVIAKDIVESAETFVPQMKEEGADIIVAIPHSGIGNMERGEMEENATYDLSKVDGIDAILFGHSHSVFPSESYRDFEGVNLEKGTINGTAAVMPGYWGSHLGIVDFVLEKKDGQWKVVDTTSQARGIRDAEGNPVVEADQELMEAFKEDHEATLDYVRGPVGETSAPINSYFALVQDDPSVQIVTNAQKWYVENYIQGTEYDGIPVLSAGAPFKAGTRGDVTYYTDVPKGTIAIKNVSDLYLYPNTLQAVLINGSTLKEWLEMSAGQFNTIDASSTEEQALVNTDFRSYNFDIIDGVTYEIDVTQPAKYDPKGNLINPESRRIVNLEFNGKAVDEEQQFIVATNNYRASGGGHFPGIDGSNIIIESPDENRQIIINYIMEKGMINPSADMNWSFVPVKGNVHVTFETSPEAQKYAKAYDHLQYETTLDNGFAKFKYTLNDESKKDDKAVEKDDMTTKEDHAEKETTVSYTVKSGDTLSEIGVKFGVEWKEIAKLNNLSNPNLIFPGQVFQIPSK